jgi:hypothetical protein
MAGDEAIKSAISAEKCPDCGAVNAPPAIFCWLCGRALPPSGDGAERPAAPPNSNVTFSLSSLMLVMTLIAVCLGAATIEPGFGIILAIAATPAVLRTMVLMKWERQRLGHSASILEKVLTFASSLLLLVVVGTASFAAFFVMCLAGFGAGGEVSAIGLGIVAGLIVLFLGLFRIWPRKGARDITLREAVNLASASLLLLAALVISSGVIGFRATWIFPSIHIGFGVIAGLVAWSLSRGMFVPKGRALVSLASALAVWFVGFIGRHGVSFSFLGVGVFTCVAVLLLGLRIYPARTAILFAGAALLAAFGLGAVCAAHDEPFAGGFIPQLGLAALAIAAAVVIRMLGSRVLRQNLEAATVGRDDGDIRPQS